MGRGKKVSFLFLLIAAFFLPQTYLCAKVHVGAVSAIKNKVKQLKDKKDKEEQKIKFKLSSQSRILSAQTNSFLSSVSADSATYTYSLQATEIAALQPGNIIISGEGNGYMRKVVSVSQVGGEYQVLTTTATLEDAFTYLNYSVHKTLVLNDATPQSRPEGLIIALPDGDIVIPYEGIDLGGGVTLDVNVTLKPTIDFNVDIPEWLPPVINSAHLIVNNIGSANLTLKAGSKVGLLDVKKKLGPPLKFPFPPIGPIPVVGELQLVLIATAAAGIEATVGITDTLSFDGGVKYSRSGGFEVLHDYSNSFEVSPPLSLALNGDVKFMLGPEFTIKVGNMAGPYVGLYPYGSLEAEYPLFPNTSTLKWKLDGGLEAAIGFKVEIFSLTLADFDRPGVIQYNMHISSGHVGNNLPVVSSFTVIPGSILQSASASLQCNASDLDEDVLSYAWSAASGTITGSGSRIDWAAPVVPSTYTIHVTVSDGYGGVVQSSTNVVVTAAGSNHDPVIASVTANPASVSTGAVSVISCSASDADSDTLTYAWSAASGTIAGTGAAIDWTAPALAGTYRVNVTVSDGRGGSAQSGKNVVVTAAGSNHAPALNWTGAANYMADGLDPEAGYSTNTYTYRVKYSDADGDAPSAGYPKVHIRKGGAEISGSPFAMTYISGNYPTGAVYAYSRGLSAGTDYTYYFEAQDAVGAAASGAPLTPADAPDVSASSSTGSWVTYTGVTNRVLCLAKEGNDVWAGTLGGLVKWDTINKTYQKYTTSNGLVANPVYSMLIDTFGNKWIGTSGGVSKFDGTNWTTYTTANGLANNAVRAIAIDTDGDMWFGTGGGVSMFDGTNWTTYTTDNGLVNNDIRTIAVDASGNKWFGGLNGGVSKFDGTNWTTYTTVNGLAGNTVNAIMGDASGNIWFGTYTGGVSKFDGTTWTTYSTANGLAHNNVNSITIDASGNKWFGTYGGGVSKFDGTNWTTYTTANGLVSNFVGPIAIDASGAKWIGTIAGISEFDEVSWVAYLTTAELSDNYVNSIAIDASGNKWFGTLSGGVSKFDGTNWTTYTTANGLANNNVTSIAVDASGNEWFGTWGGGVSKFDGTNWTTYTTVNGLVSNNVTSVAIDASGNKWFGTAYPGGVSKFDGTNWATYPTANNIDSIAIDSSGNKWFGTNGSGVLKFDGINWRTYTTADGLVNDNILSLAIDSSGNKWFGAYGGVSKFDGTNWTIYTTADGLAYDWVISIAADSSGNMWFGTSGGGISKYNGTNWTTYTTTNGLAGNEVHSIAIDPSGNKWFGTYSGGVSKFADNPVNAYEIPWNNTDTIACNSITGNVVNCVDSNNPGVPITITIPAANVSICTASQNYINRTTVWTISNSSGTVIDTLWSGSNIAAPLVSGPDGATFSKIYTTVGTKNINAVTKVVPPDGPMFYSYCNGSAVMSVDTGGGGEI